MPRCKAAVLLASCVAAAGGCVSLHTAASDGALRGREIALAMEATPEGFRIDGRMFTAVPPEALVALTHRADLLVRFFEGDIAGVARWPMQHEERVFFCAKVFGNLYKAWGHMHREAVPGGARLHWRTDRGAYGHTTALRRGRGSVVSFVTFLPKRVDLARAMNRLGIELILRVLAFATRSRLEQLWRDGKLPTAVPADPMRADIAGLAPRIPWKAGTPAAQIPSELKRFVTPR